MGAMLKKRVPEVVDRPKPGGIALGRRPTAIACKSSRTDPSEAVFPASLLFRQPPQAHTFVLPWCGACCASRAADGGCAGAADGSSAAALALVAAVAEHPHTQVAARPLNAPTAKPHATLKATLQLSPATVTTDGLPRHSRSAVYGCNGLH